MNACRSRRALSTAFAVLATLTLMPAAGQAQNLEDQVAVLRQVLTTERQAIVAANMGLSDAQSEIFWPIYRDYRSTVDALVDRRVALIKSFGEHYETLTDEAAGELLDDWFDLQSDRLAAQRRFARRLGRVLPEILVARFFQLEHKIDAAYEVDLSQQIPLIR